MVIVTYGANRNELDGFEGQTLGQVRAAFSEAYGIPAGTPATVNGRDASDGQVLRAGDQVAFVKAQAQKG